MFLKFAKFSHYTTIHIFSRFPYLRLTETARLLVRNNVRRVFGTGGTSRSHSSEKREMELKRK